MKKRKHREVDMMAHSLRTVIVLYVLLSLVSWVSVSSIQASNVEDGALSAIERGELAMTVAYEAVLEAERAGANVTSLLSKLNEGAEALSEAHMSNRVGNFDDVTYFANLCYDLVASIEAEANMLRDAAVVERPQRLFLTSLSSAVAAVCILFGGFFGWRFFKNRYYQRISQMKPEVVNNEA